MIKFRMFLFVVMAVLISSPAFADAIGELEARGISREAIEKVRMTIFEHPKYKAAQAAAYYCDLLTTKASLNREIMVTKKMKGRSGSPSYSRLEKLDYLYSLNSSEIKEQKSLYKAGYGKALSSSVCNDQDKLLAEEDAVHDKLLLNAFAQ